MANSATVLPMEMQPIVGSACALCQESILVDVDGKNCKRCGLAVHRRCSRAHRESCTGHAALATVAHDYDEVQPFEWTTRWAVIAAAAAFVLALGLGLVIMAPTPPDDATADSSTATTPVKTRVGYGAIVAGALGMIAGYAYERSRQSRSRRAD